MNAVAHPITDTFVRIEDKFLVPVVHQPELMEVLASRLQRADVGDARFTTVESIYLDSPDLDFLRDHLAGRDARVKLRVRRYAPNGVFANGVAFLEAKVKTAGVCTKERFALDGASFGAIVTGAPLTMTSALRAANPDAKAEKLAHRIGRIEELRTRYTARPRVTVRYHRVAFEGEDVRVTIDQSLTFNPIAPLSSRIASSVRKELAANPSRDHRRKLEPQRTVVLEVKHAAGRPAWLDAYTTSIGVSETSFSKYCFAMLSLVAQPTLRLVRS